MMQVSCIPIAFWKVIDGAIGLVSQYPIKPSRKRFLNIQFLYCCFIWPDSVDFRMQKLFTTASSIILADITVDALEHLDSLEVLNSRY
jgi:hypothetical protein